MIQVVVGELALQEGEALVRPIRSDLSPATVGARDLLTRAGPRVQERLQQIGAIPIGGAVITPAGDLPASFLIHVAVASDEEPETSLSVQRGLRNALRRAVDWGIGSLALPAMGAGVGHMEADEAARVQVEILVNHLDEGQPPLELTVVVGSAYEFDVFSRLIGEMTGDRSPMQP